MSSFRVALPWRSDTKSRHKKTSLRVSSEVVEFTLNETRSEANALCVPLPSAVIREILYVSLDDCFAALQIAVGGFLPALSFYRSRGTRDPTLWACSFHCQFHDLRLVLERGDFVGGEAGVFRDGFHGQAVGLHATQTRQFTMMLSCGKKLFEHVYQCILDCCAQCPL